MSRPRALAGGPSAPMEAMSVISATPFLSLLPVPVLQTIEARYLDKVIMSLKHASSHGSSVNHHVIQA